jgi:hypothetical protein
MGRILARAAIGAGFVFVTGACAGTGPVGLGGGTTTTGQQLYEAEYDLALKRWQDNAPAHYQIVVQQTCECTVEMQRPTRVTVRRTGGSETIEDVADAGSPPGTLSDDRRQAAKTVDGLFSLISQGLSLNPQDARITYEGTLGYPVSINIDPTTVPGDEIVYKVTSFQTLP